MAAAACARVRLAGRVRLLVSQPVVAAAKALRAVPAGEASVRAQVVRFVGGERRERWRVDAAARVFAVEHRRRRRRCRRRRRRLRLCRQAERLQVGQQFLLRCPPIGMVGERVRLRRFPLHDERYRSHWRRQHISHSVHFHFHFRHVERRRRCRIAIALRVTTVVRGRRQRQLRRVSLAPFRPPRGRRIGRVAVATTTHHGQQFGELRRRRRALRRLRRAGVVAQPLRTVERTLAPHADEVAHRVALQVGGARERFATRAARVRPQPHVQPLVAPQVAQQREAATALLADVTPTAAVVVNRDVRRLDDLQVAVTDVERTTPIDVRRTQSLTWRRRRRLTGPSGRGGDPHLE